MDSYQARFRLSVYKIPAVYLSGAKNVCFCTIGDFGSPTMVLADARFIFLCQNEHVFCKCGIFNYSCTDNEPYVGPQGFGGSGEKGYLFSGTWGALVIILGELGSKLLVLGLREPCPKVNYKF